MTDFYNEQISKEIDSINENIRLIRELQKGELNEALLMLSQGWNGNVADKLVQKSQLMYDSFDKLTGDIEAVAAQIKESTT